MGMHKKPRRNWGDWIEAQSLQVDLESNRAGLSMHDWAVKWSNYADDRGWGRALDRIMD